MRLRLTDEKQFQKRLCNVYYVYYIHNVMNVHNVYYVHRVYNAYNVYYVLTKFGKMVE